MGAYRWYSWLTGRGRAELHDRSLRRLHDAGPRRSFREIADRLHGRVLDIGCGTGILLRDYPARITVIGTGPDLDFLTLASVNGRESLADVHLLPADAQRLPFAGQSFDAVVVNLVLCTIPDPPAALGEICRVLKPGGLLYIYEHTVSRRIAYRAFQNLTAPLVFWLCDGCHWNRNVTSYLHDLPLTIERHERLRLKTRLLQGMQVRRLARGSASSMGEKRSLTVAVTGQSAISSHRPP